jgi:hypothetical protein
MFIKVSSERGAEIEDRDNFRAFKVVVAHGRDRIDDARRALVGLAELPDHETAWVFADALRRWPGLQDDSAWQKNFAAMIEKAKPHGWIDEARNAIKAHVEWGV